LLLLLEATLILITTSVLFHTSKFIGVILVRNHNTSDVIYYINLISISYQCHLSRIVIRYNYSINNSNSNVKENDASICVYFLFRFKLVKGEMLKFLKPECLQNYVEKMDELVNTVLLRELKENKTIGVVKLMKKLTYDMACNILFDIDEQTREVLYEDFILAFKAIHSLPINFPGTSLWKGLKARARIVDKILPIMNKRREELSKGVLSSTNDMISCLIAIRDENNQPLDDEMIIGTFIFIFVAGHDTSATLMTLMIWKLSRDQEVYNNVLEGNSNLFFCLCYLCAILSWF